ncbi:MAG: hypothetical protein HOA72_04265, partial [Desulfobacula sp.]|uniref:hypothetical protein n=1 Tax=Desulfobacula sp. TaxID=2593537 RepID=UPI002A0657CC|nr:hypothetical protein [Desulfobacula sp.]
ILKKFENVSLVKLSKKIFSSIFGLLKIIAVVIIIIIEDKLNIKLKLFFKKTPIINKEKIISDMRENLFMKHIKFNKRVNKRKKMDKKHL